MRAYLLQVHRWLALSLTPLFILITLTGIVLAFKPVVEDLAPSAYAGKVDFSQLTQLVSTASSDGNIRSIERSDVDGQWRAPGIGEYRLSDFERVGDAEDATGAFFAWVKDFHKDLLIDAGWLVEWVTYAMLAIMVAGVFLGWPKFSQSLIGWHQWLGVWLLPLALLLPLTAILMTLHVGRPDLGLQRGAGATHLAQGIQQASERYDLTSIQSASRFKAGSVLIQTLNQTLVVSGGQVTPIDVESNLPKQLHEGLWAGWFSGLFNVLAGSLVLGLTLSGAINWLRRQRLARSSQVSGNAEVLVLFASQTGTGQGLANATAGALEQADIQVDQGALPAFKPEDWQRYHQVLVVCSTTGEGQLPDMAKSWVKALKGDQLKDVSFSLLALGDRRYSHFCAGGHQLQAALINAGAVELMPLHEVDGEPSDDWSAWMQQLAEHNGWYLQSQTLERQRQTCQAKLIERVRLDEARDADSPSSYGLILEVPEQTRFAPGDLVQIQPVPGAEPRTYSVGSSSDVSPGRIRLTVGLLRYENEQGEEVLGLGSSELCLNWPVGESRELDLVSHPGFNPPEDSEQPLILVATGCGIAPFIGFLEARAAAGRKGPIWLLFGNRYQEGDFLYRDQIEALAQQNVITDLDTVFSRDGGSQRYITERLQQRSDQLMDWINRGAALYICGRASTLGRGVDDLLHGLLQARGMNAEEAALELQRWEQSGVIHRDLFD